MCFHNNRDRCAAMMMPVNDTWSWAGLYYGRQQQTSCATVQVCPSNDQHRHRQTQTVGQIQNANEYRQNITTITRSHIVRSDRRSIHCRSWSLCSCIATVNRKSGPAYPAESFTSRNRWRFVRKPLERITIAEMYVFGLI